MEGYAKEQQYYYCDLKDLQFTDTVPLHYLWIDFNVFNQENQFYLKKFQQLFEIDAVPDLETLVIRISSLSAVKKRIRIIAASSLTENFYEYIQSNSAIDRAVLFCSKKIKAEQLIKIYPKIKSASYDEKEVIRTVQKWKREETESLYFFQEADISKLHKATVRWHSLTDIDPGINSQAKSNFFEFCKKILKLNQLKEAEQLRNSKISTGPEIIKQALKNNFLIPTVNQLLKSSKNALKLAYIHWPVRQIYHFIKSQYKKSKYAQNVSYFGVIALNTEEKRRLINGKCINILQFIKASLDQSKKVCLFQISGEIKVEIKVGLSKDICNGYFVQGNNVLFNIGNNFRVQSYNAQLNLLTMSLLAFSRKDKIIRGDPMSIVPFFQINFERREILKFGQWYSLFINGFGQQAEMIDKRITENIESEDKLRWIIAREKTKIKNGSSIQNSLSQLRQQLDFFQNQEKKQLTILTAIAQINLLSREDKYFLGTLSLIQKILGKLQEKQKHIIFQPKLMQLFLQTSKMFRSNITKADLNQISENLQKMESFFLFGDQITTNISELCLFVRARCYELAQEYRLEIEVLDKMLWLIGSSEGHESHSYKEVCKMKKKAYEDNNELQCKEDMAIKKRLLTSKVSMEELLAWDSYLKLDLSGIDLEFLE